MKLKQRYLSSSFLPSDESKKFSDQNYSSYHVKFEIFFQCACYYRQATHPSVCNFVMEVFSHNFLLLMSLHPADRKWAQIMCKRQITEELWLENWSQMLPGATNYLYYSEMLVVEYVQKKVHSHHQTGLLVVRLS